MGYTGCLHRFSQELSLHLKLLGTVCSLGCIAWISIIQYEETARNELGPTNSRHGQSLIHSMEKQGWVVLEVKSNTMQYPHCPLVEDGHTNASSNHPWSLL